MVQIWYKEGFQKFVLFCGVCVLGVWVSSSSCTICCNTCHFSTELPLHHYQKLIHHLYVGEFLDFLFCSIDLFVYFDGRYCSFLFSVTFIVSLDADSVSHLTFFSGYVGLSHFCMNFRNYQFQQRNLSGFWLGLHESFKPWTQFL